MDNFDNSYERDASYDVYPATEGGSDDWEEERVSLKLTRGGAPSFQTIKQTAFNLANKAGTVINNVDAYTARATNAINQGAQAINNTTQQATQAYANVANAATQQYNQTMQSVQQQGNQTMIGQGEMGGGWERWNSLNPTYRKVLIVMIIIFVLILTVYIVRMFMKKSKYSNDDRLRGCIAEAGMKSRRNMTKV